MSKTLIHIGYIKSGSTYLQSWFTAHPAMHYAPYGLMGFKQTQDLSLLAQAPGQLPECFVISSEHLSVWKGTAEVIGLRVAPNYDYRAYQNKLCDALHALHPQATVLIVTRGYQSMLSSFYAQYLNGGGTLSFNELQQTFGDFLTTMLDYDYVVQKYRSTFGAQQVLLLPYELLRQNPERFLQIIEERLGMQQHFAFSPEKINSAMDNRVLGAYKMVSTWLYKATVPLPFLWRKRLFKAYSEWLYKKRPQPVMKWLTMFVKQGPGMQGSNELLEKLRGKAEILRHEELYKPYLKEYLL